MLTNVSCGLEPLLVVSPPSDRLQRTPAFIMWQVMVARGSPLMSGSPPLWLRPASSPLSMPSRLEWLLPLFLLANLKTCSHRWLLMMSTTWPSDQPLHQPVDATVAPSLQSSTTSISPMAMPTQAKTLMQTTPTTNLVGLSAVDVVGDTVAEALPCLHDERHIGLEPVPRTIFVPSLLLQTPMEGSRVAVAWISASQEAQQRPRIVFARQRETLICSMLARHQVPRFVRNACPRSLPLPSTTGMKRMMKRISTPSSHLVETVNG